MMMQILTDSLTCILAHTLHPANTDVSYSVSVSVSYHHGPPQVLLLYSASTEQVSVSKVLGGNITDGQLGQNHLGSRLIDLLQFVIQDVPLCIDNSLVVLHKKGKK